MIPDTTRAGNHEADCTVSEHHETDLMFIPTIYPSKEWTP